MPILLCVYMCMCMHVHLLQLSAGSGEVSTDDPCKSDKYKEMAVDAMRAQKDEVNMP